MSRPRSSVFWRTAVASALTVLVVAVFVPLASAQQDWPITEDGLGPITLGSSIDEIRDLVPDEYVIGDEVPIAPGLRGHVVSLDGAVHALIPANDSERVTSIVVLFNGYQTEQGIGPGSLVGDAEETYGDASLSWNEEDGGREVVVFEDNPAGLSFRTSEAAGPQAGIYGNDENNTVLYEPSSRLTSIWIVDGAERGSDEAAAEDADASPEPTATPEPEPTATPEPEPTATPEPEPTATPEPDPEEADDEAPSSTADELPETGLNSVAMSVGAMSLLFLGFGAMRASNRYRPWS